MREKLFLVDAYALIFRNYYAFLGRPMRNAQGLNTSAIFGFTKFLRDIIKRERPHYIGVAFDPKGGNFRNQLYPLYKANRSETPEDIIASVPHIKRILEAMRIPILEVAGYEADDVIGTLSRKASAHGFDVYMVTPDKDFGQLVTSSAFIYKQSKAGDGFEVVGCDRIKENYGVDDPRLIIDILALWGDASDNIPGVQGIGEKGAVKLVGEWGTVENVMANVDKLTGRQRDNILASRDQIILSKQLATIDLNVPIEFLPESLAIEAPDCDMLREVFQQMGFISFIQEMERGGNAFSQRIEPDAIIKSVPVAHGMGNLQGTLFGGDLPESSLKHDETPTDLFSATDYADISDTEHHYHIIKSADELEPLLEQIRRQKEFCFDTETMGFDVFNDRIIGISLSIKPFVAYYIPLNTTNIQLFVNLLKPVFEDDSIAKIAQNMKFDIMVLRGIGISVRGFKYDTMLLHYLLDPESRHNMNHLSRTYLNYSPIEIETLIGRGARQLTMDRVSVDIVGEYSAEDADVTLRLKQILWQQVVEQGFEKLYRDIDEPLIDVLADIEMAGVSIDAIFLAEYAKELNVELAQIEEQIRTMADEPLLNINSARQLGEVLFAKLKIDATPRMTKTKQYSTDEEYLQLLYDRHPIVGMILEYRGVKKLLSTYVEALPLLVNRTTGRVHTSFNQAVTATGRLSSTNPNLQNIPIRDQRGRHIRKAFVTRGSDYLLLSADYSQVELRLMAHLSGDKNLIEAFHNKEDIHTATAARLFGIAPSDVTPENRRRAKTVNFGIIYGISAFGLSQRLNIPQKEAKSIIEGYFASYSDVKHYMEKVVADAAQRGYVTTLFGRKRYLPDITSKNRNVRSLAERNAINAPIQGSASDIIKIAMITINREFKQHNLRSRMILQVHDELVIEMYKPEQHQVTEIVVHAMEHAVSLSVDITVEYGVGEDWLTAH